MSRNLINISDLNIQDFDLIQKYSKKILPYESPCLKNKCIGLIFEKESTRTRISFQVGIKQLSGDYIDIKLEELNLSRIESFEDTFEILSCYIDCLVFRTNDHKKLELAKNFFKKPIINALSDISHPCQAISDIFTLREHFSRDDNFNLIWFGDLNNVLYSLIEAINFLPNSKITVFTDKRIYERSDQSFPNTDNVSFLFELDFDIVKEADCIMTDVYNSMNSKEDKEIFLKKFQVNNDLMKITTENAIFMHCLPAKIGSEVTNDVIKGPKSIVLKQAKNRMVAQRGILKWLNL